MGGVRARTCSTPKRVTWNALRAFEACTEATEVVQQESGSLSIFEIPSHAF